jgi:LEA14-like dessication related protein
MKGGEQFNIEKIDGQTVKFTAGAVIENENWFGFKVKPSDFELYVDGDHFASIRLDKKVKVKRKSENYVEGSFTGEMDKGALLKAMSMAGRDNIKVRMKGKAKAGVFIFSKKVDMDETKTISGKNLKMP